MSYDAAMRKYGEPSAQPTTKRVIKIERPASLMIKIKQRKRVGAYCRVSTSSDEQLESLENQISAFKHQVMLHDDWELVEIYVDEGITGTSVRKREGFQRMIHDCKEGRIDYIITKSISRFARNTADCITYVRELQAMGVQLFFEKEGIDTAESYSEMLLTVMAAFAQEESRSISENVKWGMRKRFEAGQEIPIPLYGYRHTAEEMYRIVPEEADIVREIFTRFVRGELPSEILRDMKRRGVRPPAGNTWKTLQLHRMIHNEKYIGDVVLQKNYIVDHLTHREVKNRGEVPIIHIYNAHPPIVDRHLFEQAQVICSMRNVKSGNCTYPYGTMLRCPLCGEILEHGSLNAMHFGGEQIRHGGGWGCYGERGCRHFLLVQKFLDQAILKAYASKYAGERHRVDFYWLDELVERIDLHVSEGITIHWRDGDETRTAYPFHHPGQQPVHAALRYNLYLEKAPHKKRQYTHMMGLAQPLTTEEKNAAHPGPEQRRMPS